MTHTFITSDCHFGHKNIIPYENRPFRDVDEMDRELIRRWNKRVDPNDRVIFLGDFCLKNRDYYERILEQLNYGSMLWIKGNHDKGVATLNDLPRVFAVKDATIKLPGLGSVYLTHEPTAPPCDETEIVLHGHVHGREGNDFIRVRDGIIYFHVGVDTNNLRPWHIREIVRECKKAIRRK